MEENNVYIKGSIINLNDLKFAEFNKGYTGGELFLEMKDLKTFQFYLDIRNEIDFIAYMKVREKCGWHNLSRNCSYYNAPESE